MEKFETILYDGQIGRIGRFFCPPWHPRFTDTGPIHGTVIVFPRTSVTITHVGQQPIVGDPNVIMFYNQGQRYTRGKLSEEGDICDWFGFAPQVVVDALRPVDPHVDERWDRPFAFSHGPSTGKLYLRQRLLVDALSQNNIPDMFYIEEKMLAILQEAIQIRYRQKRPSSQKSIENLWPEPKQSWLPASLNRFPLMCWPKHFTPLHIIFAVYSARKPDILFTTTSTRCACERHWSEWLPEKRH